MMSTYLMQSSSKSEQRVTARITSAKSEALDGTYLGKYALM